jgi:hypothetical protein
MRMFARKIKSGSDEDPQKRETQRLNNLDDNEIL